LLGVLIERSARMVPVRASTRSFGLQSAGDGGAERMHVLDVVAEALEYGAPSLAPVADAEMTCPTRARKTIADSRRRTTRRGRTPARDGPAEPMRRR
jgi:hypothetical protein